MTPYLTGRLAAPHGFFTRQGGVSTGGYASLNGSLSGRDDPDAVHENRARAARALGLARLAGVTQVHGTAVAVIAADGTGGGSRADALVTAAAAIGLVIVTADCAPVLFADTAGRVVGAAHAGWRGAVAGVLEATLDAMTALGAARITASVGPCIAQPSYEVAQDLHDAVADDRFFTPGRPGHWHFDLPAYCAARLRLRLRQVDVDIVAADTCADEPRFFSHRRRTLAGGGVIGHQMSVVCRG